MGTNTTKYRRDIDGLRALAVLSVLFYHFELSAAGYIMLPGGCLGVDVFFVISGYLIFLQIYERRSLGTFSLMDFFRRRMRRLAPALIVVMLCSGLLGLPPGFSEEVAVD